MAFSPNNHHHHSPTRENNINHLNNTGSPNANNYNNYPILGSSSSRGSKLLLKVLSHDENGREIIILFDPDAALTNNSASSLASMMMVVAASSSSSSSPAQEYPHRLVDRVSTVLGGGSRRTEATANLLTSVGQPTVVVPASANAVTMFDLQQLLTGSHSSALFGGSGKRLTGIPIDRQMIRFEGATIVEPLIFAPKRPASSIYVADALSVSQTQAAQVLQRTIHLYDAGSEVEQKQRDAQLALDIGSVLAAPRWVAPVFDKNNSYYDKQNQIQQNNNNNTSPYSAPRLIANNNNNNSSTTVINTSAKINEASIIAPENQLRSHHSPTTDVVYSEWLPPKNPAVPSYQNSPSSRSPARRLTSTNTVVSAEVLNAERLLEAAVQAEVDRLGNRASVQAIVDPAMRSPQVQRAMDHVERARASVQLKMQEEKLKMKLDEEILARERLEGMAREQERVAALRNELERLRASEHAKHMRSLLPGSRRSNDEIARDTDLANLAQPHIGGGRNQNEGTSLTRSANSPVRGVHSVNASPRTAISDQAGPLVPTPVVPSRRIIVPTAEQDDAIHVDGKAAYQQRRAAMLTDMPPMAPQNQRYYNNNNGPNVQHRDFVAQNYENRAILEARNQPREFYPLNLHSKPTDDDHYYQYSASGREGSGPDPIVLDRYLLVNNSNNNTQNQAQPQHVSQTRSIHSYSPGPATRHVKSHHVDRVMDAVRESMGRSQ